MNVTILGSGTLLPDRRRHSAAHWVHWDDVGLLLDCGPGTVHGMDRYGVPWRSLTHLAVTHFHVDHVGDVAALLFALKHGVVEGRAEPLVIVGPPGIRRFVHRLSDAYFGYIADPGFLVKVVEIPREGTWSDPAGRFAILSHPTPHTERSVAYRVEASKGVVGYTGDTGPSATLGRFLKGTAVVIAECSLTDPPEMDAHLSPATLAALAGEAEPDLLVVTHLYPPLDPETVAEEIRDAGYDGTVVVGWDGTEVEVAGGKATLLGERPDSGS